MKNLNIVKKVTQYFKKPEDKNTDKNKKSENLYQSYVISLKTYDSRFGSMPFLRCRALPHQYGKVMNVVELFNRSKKYAIQYLPSARGAKKIVYIERMKELISELKHSVKELDFEEIETHGYSFTYIKIVSKESFWTLAKELNFQAE